MTGLNTELLAIYLQDHLAGATASVELSRRIAGSHKGTPLGDELQALSLEAINDRQALEDLMAVLEIQPDRIKTAAAWAGEKLGRLKFNGSLMERSRLSDVLELEGMQLAVAWKAAGWRLLRSLATADSRLGEADLDDLVRRADDQKTRIEELLASLVPERLTD